MSETDTESARRSGTYRYDYKRGGHAPGHLRDAFEEWVYETEPLDGHGSLNQEVVMHNGQMRTLQWLILRLWKCTDIMPFFLCEQLAMESGSTYAQGARSVRPLLKA